MKKLVLVSLFSLTLLSGCCWRKKKCCVAEQQTQTSCPVEQEVVTVKKQVRTSGPLQKEIGWSNTDYQ